MTIITGGVISVEDGTKAKEEYAPPRKVRVELRFDNPPENSGEEADALIRSVGLLASNNVAALLGVPQPKVVAKPVAATAPVDTTVKDGAKAAYAAGASQPAPAKPPGRPRKPADPAAAAAVELPGETPKAKPADDLADILGDEAKPITDADLTSAVTKKNATLKNGPKIRELIQTFAPDANKIQLSQIAAGRRQEFLTQLDGLS